MPVHAGWKVRVLVDEVPLEEFQIKVEGLDEGITRVICFIASEVGKVCMWHNFSLALFLSQE